MRVSRIIKIAKNDIKLGINLLSFAFSIKYYAIISEYNNLYSRSLLLFSGRDS